MWGSKIQTKRPIDHDQDSSCANKGIIITPAHLKPKIETGVDGPQVRVCQVLLYDRVLDAEVVCHLNCCIH